MAFILSTEIAGTINSRKASEMMPILDAAQRSNKVRGVLIHINSSGGEANASERIFRKIVAIRSKKPVIVHVTGICASGAYWIASAATKIYAMETSLVGSIGVISILPSVKRLLDRIGVDIRVLKAGEFKDMGNPFTEIDDKASQKMTAILRSAYDTFWSSVFRERKIPEEKREQIATGEIFTSSDSLRLGLIDAIGDGESALDELRKTTGIRKTKLIMPRKPILGRIMGMAVDQMVQDSLSAWSDTLHI